MRGNQKLGCTLINEKEQKIFSIDTSDTRSQPAKPQKINK